MHFEKPFGVDIPYAWAGWFRDAATGAVGFQGVLSNLENASCVLVTLPCFSRVLATDLVAQKLSSLKLPLPIPRYRHIPPPLLPCSPQLPVLVVLLVLLVCLTILVFLILLVYVVLLAHLFLLILPYLLVHLVLMWPQK